MRIFIGIPLSSRVTARLARAVGSLSLPKEDFRQSRPENWHLTLQFLGNATQTQIDCLLGRLAKKSLPSVVIQIVAIAFFGSGILVAQVRQTSELERLAQYVMAVSSSCEFCPEDRPWRTHITLARMKSRANRASIPRIRTLLENHTKIDCEFLAREFLLYESFPGTQGSRYETRARFPLRQQM